VILLISSVLVIYAVIGGMLGRVSAQNGSYQQLSIFTEVLGRIQNDYVDEPNVKLAVEGAIRGLVESVDPYGGYLTPKDVVFYKGYRDNPLKTPGIGVVLAKPPRLGYPVILSTIPGGPAAQAGLNSGDIIESIDGLTTRELNLVQINALLATPAGKPASLSVIRNRRAEPETMSVNRDVVQPPAVEAKIVEGNIAYVKIPYLSAGKAQEARRQLDGLLKKGANAVILDLRYTAGGEDKEALEIANLFINSGTLAYVGANNSSSNAQKRPKEAIDADPKLFLTKVPLALVVNQGTAGAAELIASAVEGNRRGQVVGVKTFGLASIQQLLPLDDGYGLLISTAKYFTPDGKEIQDTEAADSGIKPTIEVRQVAEEALNPNDEPVDVPPPKEPVKDEDRQLNKAIEILKDPSKISATSKAA
jgi:carboxyl-terminal processing protease